LLLDEKFDWLFKQRDSTQTEAEFIVDARTIAIDRLFIDATVSKMAANKIEKLSMVSDFNDIGSSVSL
jgi:hypothetical protein